MGRGWRHVVSRRWSPACLLAGTVGACAVVDPVDPRYDTVNRSLAKARNESILLNIIRSSHDWPMSFTTVPQVNPSMQNQTTLGIAFVPGGTQSKVHSQ